MKNSCQQKDQSPGLSAYEAKSRSVAVFDEISIEQLYVDCLPECVILSYRYSIALGRFSNIVCSVLHLITLYSQQTS